MKSFRSTLPALLLGLLIASACSSPQPLPTADTGDIPSWYLNMPQDADRMFASSTSSSRDMQTARNKATADARAELSRSLSANIQSIQESFTEEVGENADSEYLSYFMEASRIVSDNALNGSKVAETSVVRDGDLWRAYVLVEYPIGAANKVLMDQIKQNDNMYTRFRASEAFKKLDEQTQKEYMQQQQQAQEGGN